jgi:hypothetical protein
LCSAGKWQSQLANEYRTSSFLWCECCAPAAACVRRASILSLEPAAPALLQQHAACTAAYSRGHTARDATCAAEYQSYVKCYVWLGRDDWGWHNVGYHHKRTNAPPHEIQTPHIDQLVVRPTAAVPHSAHQVYCLAGPRQPIAA